jgi:D-alanine transaminase/branched-chain amino acid aminotransferase
VIDGVPVFVEDHIQRLENSLRLMNFNTGMSGEDWFASIHKLILTNEVMRAGFRIVVTAGSSEDGYTSPAKKNVYMMLHHLEENDALLTQQGVSLVTSSYLRDVPEVKTTIYVQAAQVQPQVEKAGAFEVLYHWKGEILECSRRNMFFIDQKGTMHTPAKGMLKGITRKQVIALAKEHAMPLIEREVYLDELPQMAGAFLTATTKGILPVVKIDDTLIGDGSVHPVSSQMIALFEKKVEAYIAHASLRHQFIS